MRFTVLQAEGALLYPGPRFYTEWEKAARHLREICRRKGDTMDYNKTDVTIEFDDGCVYRYRFDAHMAEIGTPCNLATFRRNALLCTKTINRQAHPDKLRHDIVPDSWPDDATDAGAAVEMPS